MIEVSGRCTSAAIETSFRPWSRASRSSGSYDDLTGGEQLQRLRGIGGRLGTHVESAGAKVAVGDRLIQRGVVGVGEEVEHHREGLGAARREHVLLGAAAGGAQRKQQADRRAGERPAPHAAVLPDHGASSRSASESA
jgi:hypothetical protein